MATKSKMRGDHSNRDYSLLTTIAACVGLAGGFILYVLFVISQWGNPIWKGLVFNHFMSVWGVAGIAVMATIVVTLFRTVEGPIKFKFIGFDFEGASGPIVMWTMVFLAMVGSAKLLWDCALP